MTVLVAGHKHLVSVARAEERGPIVRFWKGRLRRGDACGMTHHDAREYALLRSEPLLTIDEAADVLRVSRATLYRLIRGGELAPVRVGQRLRFEPSEIRRYLDSSRAATP